MFTDLLPEQRSGIGFVPVPDADGQFAASCELGTAFAVRIDEKVIPSSAVKAEVERRAARIADETGRKVGRKERKDLTEQALVDMTRKAFAKSAVLTCYHDKESGYLYLPTTSKTAVDAITSLLVRALHTIKTETITVSNVSMGLTEGMNRWVLGSMWPLSEKFDIAGSVAMERSGDGKREKISIKLQHGPEGARQAITEALARHFSVTELGLCTGPTLFRLSDDFTLHGIEFGWENEPPKGDVDRWEANANAMLLELRSVMDGLVEVFGARPAAVWAVDGDVAA
jgi:DNA recombination-dependent growth factor C